MNWPRDLFPPLALLSLGVAATPGLACGDLTGNVRQPGDPCVSQTVTQDRDLSFSIRPGRARAMPSLQARPAKDRRPIALGDGLKADAAIFVGRASHEKEVSDATRR